ncbi:hypothetical protein ACFU99_28940 [Streptomyces sp. NPDC057654]|uniref:hypothetical protein n=1 Tax=Streptomyces sp. NPDC057654 TaxID=3346196 RepID=UPI0036A02BEA
MMYTASTAANRLRPSGRTGRRVAAALVAAAALGLGATACGQGDGDGAAKGAGSSNASNSSGASASQHDSASSATSQDGAAGNSSNDSAAQGHNSGSKSAPEGGGVANAGNHQVIVGKMSYLAPSKLLVKPEDGGKAREFDVANAMEIRGAAAICGGADGTVTIGKDGYGTKRCTADQLEKAAKTGSVVVRVTMNTTSGVPVPDLVEEKYHP